jgi:hypothetical protein
VCVMKRSNGHLIVIESPLIANQAEVFKVDGCAGNIKFARKVMTKVEVSR